MVPPRGSWPWCGCRSLSGSLCLPVLLPRPPRVSAALCPGQKGIGEQCSDAIHQHASVAAHGQADGLDNGKEAEDIEGSPGVQDQPVTLAPPGYLVEVAQDDGGVKNNAHHCVSASSAWEPGSFFHTGSVVNDEGQARHGCKSTPPR
ncbi:hypothetical protein KIL84_007001 [Mauremys mutica]|uniref:Uncharacterized protein n=1 Tax=Mauremys mutica TaxID=74926 RepID=A0A9D3X1Y2_9SAUR|nr:hypothetical protein KIL84_007001 [Mauremys mutica]